MWNKQEQMFVFFSFYNVTTTNNFDPLYTVSLIAIILLQMEFDLSAPTKDVLPWSDEVPGPCGGLYCCWRLIESNFFAPKKTREECDRLLNPSVSLMAILVLIKINGPS